MNKHWTERSIKDYLFRIASDFLAQLEKKMEVSGTSQDELSEKLEITKGRVSQVLNHPGNITLGNVIKYTRALGMKVSIVAYEDNDPGNINGPINSEVFKACWERLGKPLSFWDLQEITAERSSANRTMYVGRLVELMSGGAGAGQIGAQGQVVLGDYTVRPAANAQVNYQTPSGANEFVPILQNPS